MTLNPSKEPGENVVPIAAEVFRAYDIRGLYGTQLDEERIHLIGTAIGSEALDEGIETLLAGRDGRLSSPSLATHLIAGIRASGCNVVDLGVVPTPLLYFATHRTSWSSGIMLTASHNPAAYNGIKMVFRQSSLADNQIQRVRQRLEQNVLHTGEGDYQSVDIKTDYINYVVNNIKPGRKLKLVIDCGNAVTSLVAPQLFSALGYEVIPLYCELDGSFPNHEPDPTREENLAGLKKQVLYEKADLGIAFDGDGDRLGIVDGHGEMIDTDLILATLIKSIVPDHPGEPVIYDVKCSNRLAALIQSYGGIPTMYKSGHSFMKQKMLETNAPLGGEYSAHIFIKDRWFGFDDGMYAAARLLEVLGSGGKDCSESIVSLGERFATPELKVPVPEEDKFAVMERLEKRAFFPTGKLTSIDGIRVDFSDGWGLVRASNTSAALLLRFEADSSVALERIQNNFRHLLEQEEKLPPLDF